MKCMVCGVPYVGANRYCLHCGDTGEMTRSADLLGQKASAPIGKVTSVSKCDCGAEKCRTTHASWCSTLKVEVALIPPGPLEEGKDPRVGTHRSPFWKDVLAQMVAVGRLSSEVASKVYISGPDALLVSGNVEATLDLLEARLKVAEQAVVNARVETALAHIPTPALRTEAEQLRVASPATQEGGYDGMDRQIGPSVADLNARMKEWAEVRKAFRDASRKQSLQDWKKSQGIK